MGKVIWTNHLYERIRQRGLDPSWVDKAVRFPDEVIRSSTTDSNKHSKVVNGYKITATVKRQGSDWIITSAWWNPVYGYQSKSQKKMFLERWIESLLNKIEQYFSKK